MKGVSALGREPLPLNGIRITDFSWALAGPLCTQLLGAMGAEVIKIETSKRLDALRGAEPFADGVPGPNRSGRFNNLNLCKKGCTLDLTKPEAVELVNGLIKLSDVVIENFAFGVMARLGLGHETVLKIRPDLIYVSSSGLGAAGPKKHHVAFGNTVHAFSGLTALTGYYQGPPRGIGGTFSDPLTGITAAFAILAALHHRADTGLGQFVDLSMAEATLAQLPEAVMDYTMNGRVRGCEGNRDGSMAPHNTYPTRGEDEWVCIAVSSEEEWKSLCRAMGSPSWAAEDKFSDMFRRLQHQDELDSLIGEWTSSFSSREITDMLQKAGVPAGPSSNLEQFVTDPHLRARGYLFELDHPEAGRRTVSGLPWKLSHCPEPAYWPAPMLGEHNGYVFQELLGLAGDRVAELTASGVIC
ncbi:MAG: CoA transferase [Chloroflexi bacterium]|nr:CoA transferase [Chloroflexota bacterium]